MKCLSEENGGSDVATCDWKVERRILPAVTPLALLALWLAFPAVTPQPPPINGKAPRKVSFHEILNSP